MTSEALTRTLTDLAPALKNHLWQSTLFALAAALLTLALRSNHARTRYWLWLAASLKFLIPFSLLISLGSHLATAHPAAPAPTAVYFAMEEVSQPFTPAVASVATAAPAPAHAGHLIPMLLACVWLAGCAVVLSVWFVYWRRVSAILRAATPLHSGREVEMLRRAEDAAALRTRIQLLASPSSLGPGIYGIARPVLIWPAAVSQRLSDAHLESILAHEIAHVRRRDNFTAALHMLVEAIFWFHPLVWWLGARLEAERERACDEAVLESSPSLTKQPHIYAESILKICEFYVESPLPCVSGVTGADLKQRLVNILERHATLKLSFGKKILLAAMGLVAITIPILSGQAKAMQRISALVLVPPPNMLAAFITAPESQAAIPADETKPDAQSPETPDGTGPSFEVATIRPTTDGNRQWMGMKLAPSGRLTASRETVSSLVWFAYVGRPGTGQVQGGPEWAKSEYFDINAKVEDSEVAKWDNLSDVQRLDRMKPMIRTLLAERFHLKLRTEMRITQVDVLVQAKGGAKLKAVDAPPRNADPDDEKAREGRDKFPDKAPPGGFMMSRGVWKGNACPMSILVAEIAGNSGEDRLVIDETELKGYYDFTFKQSSDKDAPAFSDQIEDQLGLKLEPRKVPIKTYVIESVEKPSQDGAELPDPAHASLTAVSFSPQTAAPVAPSSPAAPLSFEVSTVKLNTSDGTGSHTQMRDGRFTATNVQLKNIMQYSAYGVPEPRIVGGPKWIDSQRFDIEAKLDAATADRLKNLPRDQLKAAYQTLFQQMLADRFKLAVHWETRDLPVYNLVVAKGGPILATAKDPEHGSGTSAGTGQLQATDSTLPEIAQVLTQEAQRELGRVVIDKTGIAGQYDIRLKWTPDTDPSAAPNPGPSIFTAIQEQLGLKLEPARGPVQVLVIDHVEMPSEN
jgi:bla regulator protein blaR1